MSYERPNIRDMRGYTAGEQPGSSDIIKLNTNENPYPAPDTVAAALRGIDTADLRRYPPPLAQGFREVAAQLHGVTPDQIIPVNGGDELLRLAITTFVDPGQSIGVAEPSYSLYPVLAAVQGCGVVRVALNGDWSLPEAFAETLNAADVKLAFVVNPHAPSGRLESVATLERLAKAFNGVLLIDEAYADFIDPALAYDATPLVRRHDNVLILRTLSKGYSLAGLRFAYGIGATDLLEPMLYKTRDSYNTDLISQRLATAALQGREQAARGWQSVREEREAMAAALLDAGFECLPGQANFILAAMPPDAPLTAAALYEWLKKHGILVRYFDQDGLRNRLRITIGTAEQNRRLLECIRDGLNRAGQQD
ncbi:MAG: histidinol-phosphate transaminase [Pseudohongiellaceae bacterium]